MILVWICLVLALIGMLCIFAVVLFRKVIAVLQEFSDLVGRTAILDGVHRAEPGQRPTPAVLQSAAVAGSRWRSLRHDARERRSQRRSERLARGRELVRADAASIEWFQR